MLVAVIVTVATATVGPMASVTADTGDGGFSLVAMVPEEPLLPEPFDFRSFAAPPRFYISALAGASFATLVQPELPGAPTIDDQSLLSGGVAAGWAIRRLGGDLRFEVEGLAREQMEASESDPLVGTLQIAAREGWSAMANLWRDVAITNRLAIYGGGGIGAGGYRLTFSGNAPGATVAGSTQITSFAWQAGGGLAYAVTDRVTLDLGYRFLSLEPGSGDLIVTNASGSIRDTYATRFSASEVLLSVRVYEPFRGWQR
ncbi:MAG: outer membrane protein [Planctomycetia bacterium]